MAGSELLLPPCFSLFLPDGTESGGSFQNQHLITDTEIQIQNPFFLKLVKINRQLSASKLLYGTGTVCLMPDSGAWLDVREGKLHFSGKTGRSLRLAEQGLDRDNI